MLNLLLKLSLDWLGGVNLPLSINRNFIILILPKFRCKYNLCTSSTNYEHVVFTINLYTWKIVIIKTFCSIFLLTIIIRRVLLKLTEPVDINGGICTEPLILVLSQLLYRFQHMQNAIS
jgi:hypothetical protein